MDLPREDDSSTRGVHLVAADAGHFGWLYLVCLSAIRRCLLLSPCSLVSLQAGVFVSVRKNRSVNRDRRNAGDITVQSMDSRSTSVFWLSQICLSPVAVRPANCHRSQRQGNNGQSQNTLEDASGKGSPSADAPRFRRPVRCTSPVALEY